MIKLLSLVPFLFLGVFSPPFKMNEEEIDYLKLEEKSDGTYKVVELTNKTLSEYRIYHTYILDEE